jgi:hypothetical protein
MADTPPSAHALAPDPNHVEAPTRRPVPVTSGVFRGEDRDLSPSQGIRESARRRQEVNHIIVISLDGTGRSQLSQAD